MNVVQLIAITASMILLSGSLHYCKPLVFISGCLVVNEMFSMTCCMQLFFSPAILFFLKISNSETNKNSSTKFSEPIFPSFRPGYGHVHEVTRKLCPPRKASLTHYTRR
jgi:hypothetical protein